MKITAAQACALAVMPTEHPKELNTHKKNIDPVAMI